MKDLQVLHWQAETDGELDADALQRKLENAGFRVSTYTYPAGTRFSPHTHAANKCDAVLRGRFKITCGERTMILEAGDMMFVPAGQEHAAEVVGDEAVISLDGIAASE